MKKATGNKWSEFKRLVYEYMASHRYLNTVQARGWVNPLLEKIAIEDVRLPDTWRATNQRSAMEFVWEWFPPDAKFGDWPVATLTIDTWQGPSLNYQEKKDSYSNESASQVKIALDVDRLVMLAVMLIRDADANPEKFKTKR